MEGYLSYINNIVASVEGDLLQPVFGIALEQRLDEYEIESLSGYRGLGPVRIGNDAFSQILHDGYGSGIIASSQSFFHSRLKHPGDGTLFKRLGRLGEQTKRNSDVEGRSVVVGVE